MNCPRCKAGEEHRRIEYHGNEGDKRVWTVYNCQRCCFTWRDSEPAESIEPGQRDPWFQVAPDRK